MRSVNMTAEDRVPRGCRDMNLQSEHRESGRDWSKPSLLKLLGLRRTSFAMRQSEALIGNTVCRAAAMACIAASACCLGSTGVSKRAGMMHALQPAPSLNTNAAASGEGPKQWAKQHTLLDALGRLAS